MITLIRKLFGKELIPVKVRSPLRRLRQRRRGLYDMPSSWAPRRHRGVLSRTLRILAVFGLACTLMLPSALAVDSGAEFRAKDDLVVQGTEGDKNDADLEVKGVSTFSKDV
ncbi:MAG: hypothetical protein QF535_12925, partial [Anaerolineales bacterium]|nr:hypothetical protein [Anaerolineales bacterium]